MIEVDVLDVGIRLEEGLDCRKVVLQKRVDSVGHDRELHQLEVPELVAQLRVCPSDRFDRLVLARIPE